MDVRALCAPGFATAAAALFAGCASYDAVQPGQSMADVERRLSAPSDKRIDAGGGEVWDYGFYLDTWSMLLSVHFDAASGRLKYYATMPDPAVYTLRAFM